jgi:DNA-binding MurR/RpiR family transcriptional regulator
MRKKRAASIPAAPLPQSGSALTWRERIRRAFGNMSHSERIIATFLLQHTAEAGFLLGSDLAHRLNFDPATIVRFAQALGYPGYPELRAEIVADVKDTIAAASDLRQPTPGSAAAAWQGGLLAGARVARDLAAAGKDARLFVTRLRGAKQVFVIAEAGDQALGALMTHNLRLAGLRAETWDARMVPALRKGDVALGVSVASKGDVVAGVLHVAAEQGASSPAVQAAEAALLCAGDEGLGPVAAAAIAEGLRRALAA